MHGPFIAELLKNPNIGFKLLEEMPLAINVTDARGFLVYGNRKFLEGTLDSAKNEARGQYNILEEPMLEAWGLKEHIQRAFRGETVITRNLEHPNREMINVRYGKDFAQVSLYQDVYSYSILNDNGLIEFIVTLFIPLSRYCERDDIKRGREFLSAHWQEPFDAEAAANAACLSVSRFSSCFKAQLGLTPHQYYLQVRMDHLKTLLMNPNISIAQCFTECGIDYNHHYVSWFKSAVGMTPMQYRKASIVKE